MDTRSGLIADLSHFQNILPPSEMRDFIQPIEISNLSGHHRRELARTGTTTVGRNANCPCGSGKRFKRCCMNAQTGR